MLRIVICRSFFGRIEDTIICFLDCLTIRSDEDQKYGTKISYLQNIAGFKTPVLILYLLYNQLGLFPTYLFSLEPQSKTEEILVPYF